MKTNQMKNKILAISVTEESASNSLDPNSASISATRKKFHEACCGPRHLHAYHISQLSIPSARGTIETFSSSKNSLAASKAAEQAQAINAYNLLILLITTRSLCIEQSSPLVNCVWNFLIFIYYHIYIHYIYCCAIIIIILYYYIHYL